jgi:hypothetical protein
LHLTGDEGAILLAALRTTRDELQCSAEHSSGECSAEHKAAAPRVSYGDALVAMAENVLAQGITPDTPVALWDGYPIDYAAAVEGLIAS